VSKSEIINSLQNLGISIVPFPGKYRFRNIKTAVMTCSDEMYGLWTLVLIDSTGLFIKEYNTDDIAQDINAQLIEMDVTDILLRMCSESVMEIQVNGANSTDPDSTEFNNARPVIE